MNRKEIAELISSKLYEEKNSLTEQYHQSKKQIGYFYIDNLLPEDLVQTITKAFPKPEQMRLKKSLRENKYVSAQMSQYEPILEETIYAFQDSRVVNLIQKVIGVSPIYPDKHLYAGGISLMNKGQFLNPHLDNSHEKDRKQWRILNLLYYVSPEWEENFGGNLEIWPNGLKEKPLTIKSIPNRLAVMSTHGQSWHSVSPITKHKQRMCISNYYFAENPLLDDDKFHITSFRGRPSQQIRDIALRGDIFVRQSIRNLFPKGITKTEHLYKEKK